MMKKKSILLAFVLTCTLLCSVGCGRRMNSATDGTNKDNTTVEDNVTNMPTDTTNNNVVDGVVNGVEDTVDGVMNGVDDVINGTENTIDNTVDDQHNVNNNNR